MHRLARLIVCGLSSVVMVGAIGLVSGCGGGAETESIQPSEEQNKAIEKAVGNYAQDYAKKYAAGKRP